MTELSLLSSTDYSLPMMAQDAVNSALQGFALPLLAGRDLDWLAMAVRRSLAITVDSISDGPERTSNLVIRTELERVANLAESTWLQLFQLDHAADSRLLEFAYDHWDGEGGPTLVTA
jgi:hypothetical protein